MQGLLVVLDLGYLKGLWPPDYSSLKQWMLCGSKLGVYSQIRVWLCQAVANFVVSSIESFLHRPIALLAAVFAVTQAGN